MAWANYKICDCCGDRKVFYDAHIQDERYRATFGEKSDYDPIGLKAICGDCNKTHEVVIVSRDADAVERELADLRAKLAVAMKALELIESITVHSGGEIHGVTAHHWQTGFDVAKDEAIIALAQIKGE